MQFSIFPVDGTGVAQQDASSSGWRFMGGRKTSGTNSSKPLQRKQTLLVWDVRSARFRLHHGDADFVLDKTLLSLIHVKVEQVEAAFPSH